MKIGYCIICHRNTNILRTTIEILSNGDNDIYLHVDKKADINDFYEYKNKVHFIEERIDIRWGEYSLVECTLRLLKEATKVDDYVCLLSGDCLPLKNSDEIKDFFIKNNGSEFIGIQKDCDENELENNVKYEHNNLFFKKNKNIFESIIFKIQYKAKLFKISEDYKLLPRLYKGANWFCISRELCNYIFEYLEKNNWYKNAFKKAYCGDEIFFQSIVMNSKYKDKIYSYNIQNDDNHMALRYIDWNSGPKYPKILTEDDFKDIKDIKNNDCIFARKFNENIDIGKYKIEFNIK